jgi:hypothetical protein
VRRKETRGLLQLSKLPKSFFWFFPFIYVYVVWQKQLFFFFVIIKSGFSSFKTVGGNI